MIRIIIIPENEMDKILLGFEIQMDHLNLGEKTRSSVK